MQTTRRRPHKSCKQPPDVKQKQIATPENGVKGPKPALKNSMASQHATRLHVPNVDEAHIR